ncbi:S8 family serine peptidase [Myxococcota bacterium]|nr:S8 family serine peptidase [Myxococcota bacterium]
MRVSVTQLISLTALTVALSACTRDNPAATAPRVGLKGAEFVEGEILVRYSAAVTAEEIAPRLETWGATILGEIKGAREDTLSLTHLGGSFRVGLPKGISVEEAIDLLSLEGDLDFAEPNYIVEATTTPNDPFFDRLWGMPKIGAPAAWDTHTGSAEVIVGVIDTGVDYNHPDLKDNAWINPNEIPNNGIDDDQNGYIDDIYGYDFCNFDADPMDDHGHGTHCSGTIAGAGNNGIGVVGVSWRARVMALKFLCANGSGSTAGGTLAVIYAADNGATLTSNSWGGGGYSTSMYNAIQYARERGQLFVAAAGNDGLDNDRYAYYPANYDAPNVITVAASDNSDRRASFSNYGATKVDLAAPGVSIYSSITGARYNYASGTSMATPHVAGALALLYALDPQMGYEQARARLLDSVDVVAGWSGVVATGGRLNVGRMLAGFVPPPLAPQLQAEADGPDGLRASWAAVAEATTYRVYLRSGAGDAYAPLQIPQTEIEIRPLAEGDWFIAVSAVGIGGEGARSAEAKITLRDETPPGQIIDLTAAAAPGGRLHPDEIASTDEIGPGWSAQQLLDDDAQTGWATWPTDTPATARLTLDLGVARTLGEVALRPMVGFEDVYPASLEIRAAATPGDWQVLAREIGVIAPAEGWARLAFAPVEARYVEIVILERATHPSGLLYSVIGDVALYGPPTGGELLIGWTAPGDDGAVGQASRYEIRYGVDVRALEDLDGAAIYPEAPAPRTAGARQWHVLTGLEGGVTYGVSLRAFDDHDASGRFAPVAVAATAAIPPGGIEDLQLSASAPGALALRFTAPADDGHRPETGSVDHYELRLSTRPITAATWPEAQALILAPASAPGVEEIFELRDLAEAARYYLLLRAVDSGGLAGPWSAQVDADPGFEDHAAPARVEDLHGVYAALTVEPASLTTPQLALIDGDGLEGWMAAVDGPMTLRFDLNGADAPLAQVRLLPHWLYPGDFPAEITLIIHAAGVADQEILTLAAPPQPGAWLDLDFTPVTADAFSLRLTPTEARFGVRALALGEVEAHAARVGGGAARLSFIAPGDDGFMGRAARYDLRWSMAPILDEGAFEVAAAVAPLPAPLDGGAPEILFAHDLPAVGQIHFAIIAEDESGNRAPLSNPASVRIPALPPPAVVDLRVVAVGREALTVAYTAPGEGGAWADSVDLRVIAGEMSPEAFATARQIAAPPPPQAGQGARVEITGLDPGVRYEIALVALRGEARSNLSNVAQGRTIEAIPPGQIVDLVAEALAEGVELRFTAPGDDGDEGQATRYEARLAPRAEDLLDEGAARVIPTPAPQPAGRPEALLVVDLPPEQAVFFALWAVDEVGNAGPLSNVVTVTTAGQPPAAVADLRLEAARVDGLTLAFTAVGDDGLDGQAARYDLRLSDAPITTLAAFEAAAPVPTPAPQPAGAVERVEIDGLEGAHRYHLALIVEDDAGNRSPMATLSAETVDEIPPARTSDLRASAQEGGAPLSAVVVAVSSEYDPRTSATGLIDENPATVWITAATQAPRVEWAVFDLGAPRRLSGLRLRAAADHPHLLPATLIFEVERDGAFAPLLEIHNAAADGWLTRAFAPVEARRVRVTIPQTVQDGARALAAIGGLELLGADPNSVSARLDWTAPSDVGPEGRAARYELRLAPFPFEAATFHTALLTEAPDPAGAGSPQSWIIGGLAPDTDYHFAFVALDAAENRSPVSNIAHFHTDALPPSTIHDLEALEVGEREITLRFTAPGAAGGARQAAAYALRYTTGPLNEETWAAATPAPIGDPAAPGAEEIVAVEGLSPSTTYRFAARALDAEGREGALSNVAEARTDDPPERIPPNDIADLIAETDLSQDGAITLRWTAPGDDGELGVAARYELRLLTPPAAPEDGEARPLPAPRPGGVSERATLDSLEDEAEITVALRAFDDIGNASGWATATALTRPVPPAQIIDLRAEITPALITLRWTAPGADGEIGQASRYELFIEDRPIAQPDGLTPQAGLDLPSPAGSPEAFELQLPPDVPYFAAIRAVDEQGHAGPLSEVLEITAPDTIPPGPFVNLRAETGSSRGTVSLSFTAPGDDGAEGRAARFEIRWRALPGGEWVDNDSAISTIEGGVEGRATLRGLVDEARVALSIWAVDNAGLVGPAVEVEVDTPAVAPGRISDLRAEADGPDGVRLRWTATGDDGAEGQASRYVLRYSLDRLDWENGVEVATPPPLPAGLEESALIQGLESGRRYAFALRAVDERGAEGALSNTAMVDTDDVTPPAAVVDLRAELLESGRVRLTWTAAGDDGVEGRAARVEIRYAEAPWRGFEAAIPIAQNISVVDGGRAQQVDLIELPLERLIALALITVDEAGNAAPPSNVVTLETAPDPPGAVAAFTATPSGADGLSLSWICPADDGDDPASGPAARIEVFLSLGLFSAHTLDGVEIVAEAPPCPPGERGVWRLGGLEDDTAYWIAARAVDDRGGQGPLSAVIATRTPDVTAPSGVLSLIAEGPRVGGDALSFATVAASDTLSSIWPAAAAFDGEPLTAWAFLDEGEGGWLEARLAAEARVGQARLWVDEWADRFPTDLRVQIDGEEVLHLRDINPAAHTWLELPFAARRARDLKIIAAAAAPGEYVVLSEIELRPADDPADTITLTWVAPGDDGAVGQAAWVDVRYATTPITPQTFEAATPVEAPAPALAGRPERLDVTGLMEETRYYFALVVEDEAGNRGPLSNVASARTGGVPPSEVIDLEVIDMEAGTATLRFTAPGGDGDQGQAQRYDLRFRAEDLSALSWDEATIAPTPAPQPAGAEEIIEVQGLLPGTAYAFALRAIDAHDNASLLSNVAYALTEPGPDITPPAPVDILLAYRASGDALSIEGISATGSQFPDFPEGALLDGDEETAWASPAREADGEERLTLTLAAPRALDRLRLLPHPDFVDLFPKDFTVERSLDGATWAPLLEITGHVAQAGRWSELALGDAPALAIRLVMRRRARLPARLVVIAEASLIEAASPDVVTLSFRAPGDDDEVGRAARYLLAYDAAPITLERWAELEIVELAQPPQRAGAPEAVVLEGIGAGEVHFLIRAEDEVGNLSALGREGRIF